MAKNKIPSDKYKNAYTGIIIERKLIKNRYSQFYCRLEKNKILKCRGVIKPTSSSINYAFLIDYNYLGSPKTYITDPNIKYDSKIHLYKDKSLCLYDCREDPWNHTKHISDTIIPWISEWIVYYEIYKLTGIWIGTEVEHSKDQKIQEN